MPEPSYPGGKAAQRRREQRAREFGEDAMEEPEPADEPDPTGEEDDS